MNLDEKLNKLSSLKFFSDMRLKNMYRLIVMNQHQIILHKIISLIIDFIDLLINDRINKSLDGKKITTEILMKHCNDLDDFKQYADSSINVNKYKFYDIVYTLIKEKKY
jgi:hypothetical protein